MNSAAEGSSVAERILQEYGLSYARVLPPQKGYRNQSFPVVLKDGRTANLILYKSEPGMLQRIKNANAVSDFLAGRGFPARKTADIRIIRLESPLRTQYGALYNYLPGNAIPWEAYTQDHLKLLGKTMSDMHAALARCHVDDLPEAADEYLGIAARMKAYFSDAPVQRAMAAKLRLAVAGGVLEQAEHTLIGSKLLPGKQPLHMDFVRGNILWTNPQTDNDSTSSGLAVSGILDFEKTAYGHPLFDIARTLAFLLVDCRYKTPQKTKKYFLTSGYAKRGAATLPDKHTGMLEPLTSLFLFHDFYKFLRHNPYEFLSGNEHFVRTKGILLQRGVLMSTELWHPPREDVRISPSN